MAEVQFSDFFSMQANSIEPPENFKRYRRGLIITPLLITAIFLAGLEFSTVSAGGIAGIRVTHDFGVHLFAWGVFAYYMYAFHSARRAILQQLEQLKAQTLWPKFVEWLCRQNLLLDAEEAVGRPIKNFGLSYESDLEDLPRKQVGATCRIHVNFSTPRVQRQQLLAHRSFAESEKHEKWIQHTYEVSEKVVREFDRRRGYALASNRLVWLEYRLPYIAGWFLSVVGMLLYLAWLLIPGTLIGGLVPLGPLAH